jgi:hypothetical protein
METSVARLRGVLMTRNEMLQEFILEFGLLAEAHDLGRETRFAELWSEAKKVCFDCEKNELLDALYTLPRGIRIAAQGGHHGRRGSSGELRARAECQCLAKLLYQQQV